VILKALKEKGIHMHTNSRVTEINTKSLSVLIDGVNDEVDVTTVVIATKPQPRDRILKQLENKSFRIEIIGTAKKAMNVLEIIHSSYKFANELEL
ncbi:MAG: hypothetical protein ACXAB5_08325, partial [Candidatus Thorarchaeota archaeon]|jgi:thioredoxin reductase